MNSSRLIEEFNESKFVSCISKEEVDQWIKETDCICLKENGEIVGIAKFRKLTNGWKEISPVFLLSRLQGKGLGKKLFKDITELATNDHSKLIATTRNPKVERILKSLGYKKISILELPLKVFPSLLKKNNPSRLFAYLKKGVSFFSWRTYLIEK